METILGIITSIQIFTLIYVVATYLEVKDIRKDREDG